ncbi:MFS general substrate transporter [Macrolepiota fuliginosa MF-IS2]|uniref:MFS general substrate transporter n=1 Tax=Macrolepiota fuliginosa MF-IS2 TaxID=1400762 RepID=A0A9P6C2Q0_9AGAR|nr:MFS general substrate transporter [Macrolepiota fuliginosa MF-IS2]
MSEKHSLENRPGPPSVDNTRPHSSSEISEGHGHDTVDMRNGLSRKEKWFVVILIALTALFSPFTANIYFPAIPTIAQAFDKPIELINLTVTVYVVLQGTSPMFWGTMSDNLGRRPIAAACLLILSLSCVGLALVPTSAYWLLMVLRCLQAAGSASTIAIGAGVISDISTPAERGGFYGFFALGPMAGPALGPVIGGALTQGLGWRAIFWFLCIAVSICLTVLITFFPETLPSRQFARHVRSPFKILYIPIIPIVGRGIRSAQGLAGPLPNKPKKFQNPFLMFTKYDIVLLLILNGTSFSVFFGVVTSLSTLFEETYPFLDEVRIGLCFLAMGGGMAVGTSLIGKFLDWRYRVEKRQFLARLSQAGDLEKRLEMEDVKDVEKLSDFPIERARLRFLPELVVMLGTCSAGYGWCLHNRVHLAVPLILHIIMGLICMAVMNGTTTLMIDLAPGQGSTVTACSNFVRCSFSAIIISIIQPLINAIGVGWTYVLLAGFVLISLPLFYVEMKFGPRWRIKRTALKPVVHAASSLEGSVSTDTETQGEHLGEDEDDRK